MKKTLSPRLRFSRRTAICLAALAVLVAIGVAAWWRQAHLADYLLSRGEQLLEAGDLAGARECAERLATSGYPNHAHLLRGEALLRADKVNPAIEEINQIPEEDTSLRLKAAETFGMRFLVLQRRAEAAQMFKYVLSKNPDHLNAHRGLAAIYFDQGAASQALRHGQEWSRLSPRDGNPHRFMGVVYMDMGDNNNFAIASFKEALARELSEAHREEVKRELAEVLIRETDYAAAWEILQELGPRSQALEKTKELKGEALMKLNRPDELKAFLAEALAQFPNNTRLLWLQAHLYLDSAKPQEAADLLERALRLDRHCTRCRQLLAQAYVALGRQSDATQQIRQMEATQKLVEQLGEMTHQATEAPWDQNLRLRIASVCDQLDKFGEAANWRQAAALCPPTNPSSRANSVTSERDNGTENPKPK